MVSDVKKRGLESLLSQGSYSGSVMNEGRYTRTVGFKVTEKQYETYRRHSKYFGIDDLIKKWRGDLDKIEQDKGKDMESVETEIRRRLNK